MEKADLNVAAFDTDKWQYILEQSFSAFKTAEDITAANIIVNEICTLGCTAVKSSLNDYAKQCYDILLHIDIFKASADVHLNALKNMLIMAARMRQKELFSHWLILAEAVINQYIETRVYAKNVSEFLKSIIFIVCDRRYTNAFAVVQRLLLTFIVKSDDKECINKFITEWTSLIAQIVRRNWQDVTDFLCNTLFIVLIRKNDFALIKSVLLQMNLNYQMLCRWDGFEKTFAAYSSLHRFVLILFCRAKKSKIDYAVRKQYLLLALRSTRDLITNISRVEMQDELQIIKSLFTLLSNSLCSKRKRCVTEFFQLEINYWNLTKPKTSRKQMSYLSDLLEPNLISDDLNVMLKSVS